MSAGGSPGQVLFQDDKIGQLARLDRSDIALAVHGEGRGGSMGSEGFPGR